MDNPGGGGGVGGLNRVYLEAGTRVLLLPNPFRRGYEAVTWETGSLCLFGVARHVLRLEENLNPKILGTRACDLALWKKT